MQPPTEKTELRKKKTGQTSLQKSDGVWNALLWWRFLIRLRLMSNKEITNKRPHKKKSPLEAPNRPLKEKNMRRLRVYDRMVHFFFKGVRPRQNERDGWDYRRNLNTFAGHAIATSVCLCSFSLTNWRDGVIFKRHPLCRHYNNKKERKTRWLEVV